MTRATSVIDNCIDKWLAQSKVSGNKKKRDTAESIIGQNSGPTLAGPAGPATMALKMDFTLMI